MISINAELNRYKELVQFLGKVMGDDVEVILHDVTDLENSVIAISETNLSGREIGSPVTNLILKMLKEGKSSNKPFITNYEGLSKDGTILRSSTFFIRNDRNEIIGMLCVNADFRRMENVVDYLSKFVGVHGLKKKKEEPVEEHPVKVEHLSPSIEDLASSSIKEIVGRMHVPPQRMSQEEKLEIIDELNQNGIFLLKGIVTIVAEELSTSEASIYRYLSKVKRGEMSH
ncbi:MAG: PAS domain-containing protein [Sporolactobacillus sp.]